MELSAGYLLGLTRASTDRTNEAWAPPAAVLSPPPPPPPPLLPSHLSQEMFGTAKRLLNAHLISKLEVK